MKIQERVDAYFSIDQQIKALEKMKKEHKAVIEAEYVKKDGLEVDGFTVTLSAASRNTIDTEEIQRDWPKLWAFMQRFMKTTYFTQLRVAMTKSIKKAA